MIFVSRKDISRSQGEEKEEREEKSEPRDSNSRFVLRLFIPLLRISRIGKIVLFNRIARFLTFYNVPCFHIIFQATTSVKSKSRQRLILLSVQTINYPSFLDRWKSFLRLFHFFTLVHIRTFTYSYAFQFVSFAFYDFFLLACRKFENSPWYESIQRGWMSP